jgi:hypothetical protein
MTTTTHPLESGTPVRYRGELAEVIHTCVKDPQCIRCGSFHVSYALVTDDGLYLGDQIPACQVHPLPSGPKGTDTS